MLHSFRKFCQNYPKLSAYASDASIIAASIVTAGLATQSIKDPEKRAIAWDNFLDVESYQRGVRVHEKQKLR